MHPVKQILVDYLKRIPALPNQARGDVSNDWVKDALDSCNRDVSLLLKHYAALRVRGYWSQASFIHVFCEGVAMSSPLVNRANAGCQMVEASAAYQLEFAAQLDSTEIDELWNKEIAAATLRDIAESALNVRHLKTSRAACDLAALIAK